MPLTGIQLLFETLVQRTRELCKCEKCENRSKDCNRIFAQRREPAAKTTEKIVAAQNRRIAVRGCWTGRGALLNPPP
ncbi:hypothetical protein [Porphyrobacter sp. HT-58-2]|uniref:hypothetical protein n=1 Tax=Porphyrobacter sp. HT-58-2 TaxID=2023229 RepID=UPI0011B0AC32|nr:hypothetical protein [Porphyrobacter sp. HT-58-2]